MLINGFIDDKIKEVVAVNERPTTYEMKLLLQPLIFVIKSIPSRGESNE